LARWEPYYTDRELELDRRIHAFGLLLALIATPVLLGLAADSRRPGLVLPCAIYLLSLLGMLGSSTLFRHTPLRWSKYRWFLRRLDHAAIFLFIAGTYTPFTVGQVHGERVGPTVAVWAGALIGVAYKLAFPVAFAALALFVLFGLRPTLVSMAPPAVGLILAGLALYMVGAAIHHRPVPFHTPIWHGCVIVGAAYTYERVRDFLARRHKCPLPWRILNGTGRSSATWYSTEACIKIEPRLTLDVQHETARLTPKAYDEDNHE